jgi:hypothetical protein
MMPRVCYFDEHLFSDNSYCKLGIASGAIAIGIAVVCNALDLAAPSNKAVLAVSFISSMIMFLLWISCFGYLTDGWLDTNSKYDTLSGDVKSSAEITLAFSFLSIPAWIAISIISYKSYVRVERVQFCTESKDTSKPM